MNTVEYIEYIVDAIQYATKYNDSGTLRVDNDPFTWRDVRVFDGASYRNITKGEWDKAQRYMRREAKHAEHAEHARQERNREYDRKERAARQQEAAERLAKASQACNAMHQAAQR